MQKELSSKSLESIGEEITHDLGAKMVKDFQDLYPMEMQGHFIGREIIERILLQPQCAGIAFYNAINEKGDKTLVLVGVDSNNTLIRRYSYISESGDLKSAQGIVADRNVRTDNDWSWWYTLVED